MIEVVTRGHTLIHYNSPPAIILIAATTVHCHDHRLIGTKTDSERVQYGIDGVTGSRWFVAISSSRGGITYIYIPTTPARIKRHKTIASWSVRKEPPTGTDESRALSGLRNYVSFISPPLRELSHVPGVQQKVLSVVTVQ